MKETYGDVVGVYFGPKYTVVINDYLLGKEAISHQNSLDRPTDLLEHLPLGFGKENGEKWIEQRRFSLSVSRDLGLGRSSWEGLVMEEVNSFLDEIQKSGGEPLDISKALEYSITSNIISLLIGRRLSRKDEANKVKLCLDYSNAAFSNTSISQIVTVIPKLRKLLEFFKVTGYNRVAKIVSMFQAFVKEEVELHKKSQGLNDFISSYLDKLKTLDNTKSNTKHYFSEEMLEGNVAVLFLGASDTIRNSLGWLFRLMADHRKVQDKVYQELINVVGKDGLVKYEERHNIPYTFAVVMEAQRFSSIVPLSTPRKAIADFPVGDYIIPKGAEITVNFWGLHHDPKYWNEPDKFTPERFLTDGGTKLIKQTPSFVPFSLGKRNCPGETIAWMEILAYFSHVVRKFEISFPPGVKPGYEVEPGIVERLLPRPLCFKERD